MPLNRQRGATLLEGLIAIVIFSFAVLGVIALQANTMRHNHNAQVRAQASFYAEQLLGLATADPSNAVCYAVNNSTGCASAIAQAMVDDWQAMVLRDLPGAAVKQPAAVYTAATRRFRLVLQWQREHETTVNNMVFETVLRP